MVSNPALPILAPPGNLPSSGNKQRQRRAEILASIRKLLTDKGLDGVTMRGIAQDSGYAVQTIYNLAGPREEAVVEAISEFTRHVGLMALPDPDNPNSVLEVIDHWIRTVEAEPEFCRQVCKIFFTPARDIFYHFRDKQLKAMQLLLTRQRRRGIIRSDVSVSDLAQQLIVHATALCVEWSDRPFPLDQLHSRLRSAFSTFFAQALSPELTWKWEGVKPVYRQPRRRGH